MPFAAALMPPRTFVLLPEAIGDTILELVRLKFYLVSTCIWVFVRALRMIYYCRQDQSLGSQRFLILATNNAHKRFANLTS